MISILSLWLSLPAPFPGAGHLGCEHLGPVTVWSPLSPAGAVFLSTRGEGHVTRPFGRIVDPSRDSRITHDARGAGLGRPADVNPWDRPRRANR